MLFQKSSRSAGQNMIRAIRMALYRTMKAWKEAISKPSKSRQKVPAALCPGAFCLRFPKNDDKATRTVYISGTDNQLLQLSFLRQ